MTALLDRAVASVRLLAPERQDDLARLLLQLAGDEQPVLALPREDEESFRVSLDQELRGEFASDARITAIWAKHGL